jgi:hypothetical protein
MISLGTHSLGTSHGTTLPQTPTHKITSRDFTPRTLKLAKQVRAQTKQRVVLEDAFPEDKDDFVWEAVKQVQADAAPGQETANSLARLDQNVKAKLNLIKYVSQTHPQFTLSYASL